MGVHIYPGKRIGHPQQHWTLWVGSITKADESRKINCKGITSTINHDSFQRLMIHGYLISTEQNSKEKIKNKKKGFRETDPGH